MKWDELKQKVKDVVNKLFNNNKYEKEIDDYLDLAQDHPNDMRIRLKIAETYYKAGMTEKAIDNYRMAASQFLEDNFVLKAIAANKQVLKIDPDRVEINQELAGLYLKLNMRQEAITQYQIAKQYFMKTDNKEKALEIAVKLVEMDPSPMQRRKLAEIYQLIGEKDASIKEYERIARLYRQEKQYDKLLKIYELILTYKPDNHRMIRDICILHMRNQHPDKAIKTIERHNLEAEDEFVELYGKARIMQKELRNPKAINKAS